MKRNFTKALLGIILSLTLIATFLPTVFAAPGDPALTTAGNPTLYAALHGSPFNLDPDNDGTITQGEMAGLPSNLNLSNKHITDLTGMEYATDVTQLNLGNNEITDISKLNGLTNLHVLYLNNNQITDLTSLAGLTNLTHLYLDYNNGLADITSLTGLSKLLTLVLSHDTALLFPPSLSGMTALQTLELGYIPGLSGKANFEAAVTSLGSLASLSLTGSGVKDVSFLSPTAVPTLRTLGWGVTTLTPSEAGTVSGLSQITTLLMTNDHIGDASLPTIGGLTNLTYLNLWDNQLSSLAPISGLTNLRTLYMGYNYICDLSPLSGMHLDTLDCQQNYLDPTSGSADITDLAALNVPHLTASGQRQITVNYTSDPTIGTPSRPSDTVYYEQSYTAPGVTETGDMAFTGWDTNNDGNKDVQGGGDMSVTAPRPISGNTVEFTAVYDTAIEAVTNTGPSANAPLYNALKAARPGLDLNGNGTIMDFELQRLTGTLDLQDKGITNINGLQYCTQITELKLGNNYPYPNNNQISDISSLSGLTNLQRLFLSYNLITDTGMTHLATLTNLTHLYLDYNTGITDISGLTALTKLRMLILAHDTNLTFPASLSGMTALNFLDLSYIPGLSSKTNFQAAVSSLPHLFTLSITYSGVTDVSFLSTAPELQQLFWGGTFLSPDDVYTLKDLSHLKSLDLVNDHIGDAGLIKFASMPGLTQLTELGLWDNFLTDLSPIAGMTNLKRLRIGANYISDLSTLTGLHLNTLDCSYNDLDPTTGSADRAVMTALNPAHLDYSYQHQYNIYYQSNPAKGTPERTTDTVYYQQSFKTPRVTTFGYDFLGWDINSNGTADVQAATVTTFAPAAQWENGGYNYTAVYSASPQLPSVYLKAIELSVGARFSTTKPFSPTKTTCTIYLNEATPKLTITPVKAYDSAAVKIANQAVTSYTTPTIKNGKSLTVKVKVSIPGKSRTYTLTVKRAKSTDSYLSDLHTSTTEKITPMLNKTQDHYTLELGENTKSVRIYGAAEAGKLAKVYYSGKKYTLNNGQYKTATIKVKAQNGSVKKYTIKIHRANSTNANLKSLKTNSSAYKVQPAFSAGVTTYSVTLPANKSYVIIYASKAESHAKMTINGQNKTSLKVNVPAGSGLAATVHVIVTAQAGGTKDYVINIYRP